MGINALCFELADCLINILSISARHDHSAALLAKSLHDGLADARR